MNTQEDEIPEPDRFPNSSLSLGNICKLCGLQSPHGRVNTEEILSKVLGCSICF